MKRTSFLAIAMLLLAVFGGGGRISAQEIGDEYIIGEKVYKITGNNLVLNGSFDDGTNNWYNGAWTSGTISNSTVTAAGGFDNGAYITISGAGAKAESTLRNVIPVEQGKTYLFRCYTSGKSPSRGNIQYNGLWKGTEADGKTEGDALYKFQWGAKNTGTANHWTENNYVFTPDGYDYVVIRAGWNESTKLDGFFIGEIEEVRDITGVQSWGEWTGNLATGQGQHWDGTGASSYHDNSSWWASNTFENSQEIKLPVGAYLLRGIGRAAANDGTDTYMSIAGKSIYFYSKGDLGFGIDTSGKENFSSTGTYANNNKGRGWEERNIPLILTEETTVQVKFGYSINYTSEPNKTWSWASICAPVLYKTDITVAMMMPLLREVIRDAKTIKNMNSAAASMVQTQLSSAEAITLESNISDAITAYRNLQSIIPDAKAMGEAYDILDNEIKKAGILGISTTSAEAVRDSKSSTVENMTAATQQLKVDEYNYVKETFAYQVELGTWTAEGPTGQLETQHWSGANSPYLEQSSAAWGTNSWTISYSQDLTLPKGNYVFKVAGRKEVSEQVVMTLSVKKGSETLGSVNDFPEGGIGKGLDTSGATNFGDGTYANSNNGFGWEWRYVKFTLDEEATVKVAVDAKATAKNMWVSFCDATVQTDNEANISLIKYNIALNDAKLAVAKEDYKNVNGGELVALNNAIGADATLDKTDKAAIETATNTLKTATEAFIVAKTAYDEYAAAVVQEYAELPYAAAAKYTALLNAQAPAIPASAEDAATKTNAIIQAYRVYLESNALAEGVDGAKVIDVPDYRFAGLTRVDNSIGAWTIYGQTNGNIQLLSSESFTDGEGKSDYTYIDIYKNDNNAGIQQSLELEPGKYMMTVTARCKSGMGAQFQALAGGVQVDIPQMGNAGGQFGRGWNDVSVEFVVTEKKSVNLGVKSNWGKDIWWGATRFRLVKLAGTESANISISSAEYSTFIAPFEVKIPAGLAAYTVDRVADNGTTLVMTEVETTIPANTPVVLNGAAGVYEVSGVNVATQDSYTVGLLTGVYTETPAPEGSYVLQNKSEGVAFYYVESGKQPTVKANRAYLTVPAEANVRALFFGDDEATAIEGLGALTEGDIEGIYSANGVKVGALQKGVNIIKRVDGSSFKVMVK